MFLCFFSLFFQIGCRKFQYLNDILRARFCHGLALPPGVALADAQRVFVAAREMANLLDAPLRSRRLGSGSFVQDLAAALQAAAPLRFSLFSAHDDTLRALLFALASAESETSPWPAYASHIALELWQNASDSSQVSQKK
jgi:hypothetical protein